MNYNLDEKISILLRERTADKYYLTQLEKELSSNKELQKEYLIQKSVKALLSLRIKKESYVKKNHNEFINEINRLLDL